MLRVTYNDQAGIQALSQIPSREELLGKLLGSIQSPITNFARVLNQIAEQKGGADRLRHQQQNNLKFLSLNRIIDSKKI